MRWLRWFFVCHRGRDCSRVDVQGLRGDIRPPPGWGVVVRWTCGGCGRVYERWVSMEEIYEGPL